MCKTHPWWSFVWQHHITGTTWTHQQWKHIFQNDGKVDKTKIIIKVTIFVDILLSLCYIFPSFRLLAEIPSVDKPGETESTTFVLSCFVNLLPWNFLFFDLPEFFLFDFFSLSMIKKFCLFNTIYLKIKENSCIIKMLNKIKEIENVVRRYGAIFFSTLPEVNIVVLNNVY